METRWFKWWNSRRVRNCGATQGEGLELGEEIFIIARTNAAQEWAIAANKKKKALTEQDVPRKYQKHAKVFSEEAARRFPPARPEDHAIKLVPDALASINCKVYPLTKAELEATEKFI